MSQSTLDARRTLRLMEGNGADQLASFVLEDEASIEGDPRTRDEASIEQRIVSALRTVYDPEIPLNIYDLGLVYRLKVAPSGAVRLTMTLTAPGCPVASELVRTVHSKILGVPGVTRARTELVWDPPWTRDRLTDAARLALGLY
jgi:FeS assembly SUF system protein